MEIDFTAGVIPTSYGPGPFHPAIRNGSRVWYWPNVTFATEDEAYWRALLSLADALQSTIEHVKTWNVVE
jgi:hypothetical protein